MVAVTHGRQSRLRRAILSMSLAMFVATVAAPDAWPGEAPRPPVGVATPAAGGGDFAPGGIPVGIAGERDVSVTGDSPAVDNEPSIAVDPTDPSHLLAAVQHLAAPGVHRTPRRSSPARWSATTSACAPRRMAASST